MLWELSEVLTETIRQNVSIDWPLKESVRAKLKVAVKRILRKYGYPPDMQKTGNRNGAEAGGDDGGGDDQIKSPGTGQIQVLYPNHKNKFWKTPKKSLVTGPTSAVYSLTFRSICIGSGWRE
jgi:hypothetical protein